MGTIIFIILFNPLIFGPWWVAGFIDDKACFHVSVIANNTMKLGFSAALEFSITQHVRDVLLMNRLIEFFGCDYIAINTYSKVQFRIRDRSDLAIYLFPFLDTRRAATPSRTGLGRPDILFSLLRH